MTSRRDELAGGIEGAAQPLVDATGIYHTRRPDIPTRRKDRPFTDTGMDIRPDLSENDWRGYAPEVRVIGSASQLIVGDYANEGINRGFVKGYAEIAELTGLEASTIEVYASICRSIPRLIRINRVYFGHYQLIAPLPEEDRERWIQFVAEHGLSVRDLRKSINEHYHALPPPPPPPVTFAITNEKELRRAGKEIAKIEQMPAEKRKKKHFVLYQGYLAGMEQYIADRKKWLEQGGAGDSDGA
jgi:hypothetical protein